MGATGLSDQDDANGRARNSRRDPELTRSEILEAAVHEFAAHGPNGARTEDIARRTNTSKRMIFYYFESKSGLYRAVLEENYLRIRALESALFLDDLEPPAALRELVRASLAHYERHPDLARIVAMENLIMHGAVAEGIEEFKRINGSAVETISRILERGRLSGDFATGPDAPSALDVHQVLSALIFNRIEHRSTFRLAFGRDMLGDDAPHVRSLIERTVLGMVLTCPHRENCRCLAEGPAADPEEPARRSGA